MKINVTELKGIEGDSDYSGDSDLESGNSSIPSWLEFDEQQHKDKQDIKGIIYQINTKFQKNEIIDLSEYPALFVVHYRGVHFFKSFFNQTQRQDSRYKVSSNQEKEDISSPAIYELANITFSQSFENVSNKKKFQMQVRQELLKLQNAPCTENFWVQSNNKKHDNLLYQNYHRYVNNYESFRNESNKKQYECYKLLSTSKNPYVSTTSSAKHALLYALGGKTTTKQSALRPTYDEDLRAKHPKVGYVQIIIHTLEDIIKQHPLFLSSLHASNKIDIKCRTLNERETTFLSFISVDNIACNVVIRFPSFKGKYKSYYKDKYGLSKSSYNSFKKTLNSNQGSTSLLDKISKHYAKSLENFASRIVEELGGYQVHINLDGTLSLNEFSSFDVSDKRKQKKDLGIYSALSKFINGESLKKSLEDLSVIPHDLQTADITIPDGFDDVTADGFCFYHAVAGQLGNNYTEQLQNLAILHILDHPEQYQNFLAGLNLPINNFNQMIPLEALNAYINYHLNHYDGENNTWADHLMIQAVANALSISIRVHMFNLDGTPQIHHEGGNEGQNIILSFTPNGVEPRRVINIGNINDIHFVTQRDDINLQEINEIEDEYNSLDGQNNNHTILSESDTITNEFVMNDFAEENIDLIYNDMSPMLGVSVLAASCFFEIFGYY